MLKFNEFLKEDLENSVLEIDSKFLLGNLDNINDQLDILTEKPYQNAPIFLAQLRGLLNRFGMMLPDSANALFLSFSAELIYSLGETAHYLYIVFDTNDDGFVDGYAQVVTREELKDLVDMETDDILDTDRDPIKIRPSTWYAKRDDDAGNTDEY